MQIYSLKWPGLKKILKFIEMEECRGDKNGQMDPIFVSIDIPPFQKTWKFLLNLVTFRQKSA